MILSIWQSHAITPTFGKQQFVNWVVSTHALLVYKTADNDDCTASLTYNKGANRKGGAPLDGWWHSKEAKVILGNLVKGA